MIESSFVCRKCSAVSTERYSGQGRICIPCFKRISDSWKQENLDKYRRSHARSKLLSKNNPYVRRRDAAHRVVYEAIKSGVLTRQFNCSRCHRQPAEAHHEDYEKKLDVIWLCDACHAKRHAELGWGLPPRTKTTKKHGEVYASQS